MEDPEKIPVYMCPECGAVYTEKVTQCDCHFGEQKWREGYAIFEKEVEIRLDEIKE